jgi:hypothetical protein
MERDRQNISMTKRSRPPITALKLATFPLRARRPKTGILTPVGGSCRALLCMLLGAEGPGVTQSRPGRSPDERKMGRMGHWAPSADVRHFRSRATPPEGLQHTDRLLRAVHTEESQPASWPTQTEYRNERKRMDASARQDDAHDGQGEGRQELAAQPADPISRLEAEIEGTDRQTDGASPQETERLLEETWSLFTECLVIRDGLLEACEEIERTMGGLQRRLGTLGDPEPTNGHVAPANGALPGTAVANGITPANGNGHGNGHANGQATTNGSINGNGAHPYTNGASSNGHSNGAHPN